MKQIALALLVLFLLGAGVASAETVSRIAAVVNSEIITTHQLDTKLQEYLAKLDRQPSPVQLATLRKEFLSRLIEESLVQQRIRALNLKVSDEEVETALLDVQKKNKLTRQELEEAVLVQGLSFDKYRDNLRQQILRYKLVSTEVRSQVEVSEQEVVAYYRAHLDDYRLAPAMQLSALSFPQPKAAPEAEKERLRSAAHEALARLRQGGALEEIAAAYRDSHGASLNAMGRFTEKDLSGTLASALADVAVGGYSEPVETGDMLAVFKVEDRSQGGLRQFDEVQYDIRQMILDQKTDARIKEWTSALRAKAFIDIRL